MYRRIIILSIGFFAAITSFAQFKLYEKGVDSYRAGKYADAVDMFNQYMSKATRDKSMDVEVYYLRALSEYKRENYKRAVEDFQEALLLNHKNKGNVYWFLAKSQYKLNEFQESIDEYTHAIQELYSASSEDKAKLYYERSKAYSKLGDLKSAYGDLSMAKSIYPSSEINAEHAKVEGLTRSASNNQTQKQVTEQPKVTEKPGTQLAKNDPPKNDVKTDLPKNETSTDTKPEVKEQPKQVVPEVKKEPEVVTPPVNPLAELYKDERRYALVIGNSNYPKEIGVLRNPVNDATDVAEELRNSKFEVQLLTNATYGQMRAAMLKFKEKVDAGEKDKTVALFYYAGHGLAHDDENFLVPIDASIEYEDDIARYCFPVQRMVLANMERSNSRMNIVVLDACRNNPFPALTRSAGQQGLGEMKRGRGSFIAYATAPGSVASDGQGRNGLYTQELLKALKKPGLTIEQVFKEVRMNVLRLSNDKQFTWDSSNIIGEFYFKF